jgi:hypothetical protein
VFLSHTHQDVNLALLLAETLAEMGIGSWRFETHIDQREDIADCVREAITEADGLDGLVDAAICRLELHSLQEVADIGLVSGTVPATIGMLVTKRGRTFGWIGGTSGSYSLDFPQLPAVTTTAGTTTTMRTFKNQIQIHTDFPQSIVFGEYGDSGSAQTHRQDREGV